MSAARFKWIPAVLLVLGCHAPGALAQSASAAAGRLHANAVALFRQAGDAALMMATLSLPDARDTMNCRTWR